MLNDETYPIGTSGQKWNDADKQEWLSQQIIRRSYQSNVLSVINKLSDDLAIHQYGKLQYGDKAYPLISVRNEYCSNKPNALITGGVHGYETSGVHGALHFIEHHMSTYSDHFNLIVLPCISPWGYETINRWNPETIDPNRSFVANSPAKESAAVFDYITSLKLDLDLHIDLHETTDTDNSEFRPALAARDNTYHPLWEIPDGFYLVGDSENPCNDFQAHIIEAVSQVTHIAPADENARIIGEPISQTGVINYATKKLGLCTGFSDATFNTTTEVYPDSPKVDDNNCAQAQVSAICSALNFVRNSIEKHK